MMRLPGDVEGVPSPSFVAALDRLGMLRPEKVPLWAAYWMAAGCDGEHLVYLAGLHGDDPHDVRDALPDALRDCGTVPPDSDAAAAAVAFDHFARMHVGGQAAALWVAQKVDEVIVKSSYSPVVMAMPLGGLYDLDCEWDGGWGRSREQLAVVVHEACVAQIRSGAVDA